MNMTDFHATALDNGLKIIQEDSPTDTVYCGLFVDAGTRDEDEADLGLAHFCEHTTFKGTTHRRAWHIRNGLERVGGDLNAYTNKEETVYYASVLREDFDKAADLLFDIVFHSVYPEAELQRESQVIIDEIDSYNDSPAELIYDEFEEMLFRGHGLGRNILGKASRLAEYHTADALRFTSKYYRPANVTLFVYGKVKFDHIVRLARKLTAGLTDAPAQKVKLPLPAYKAEDRTCDHSTHQAHVLIGNRGYSAADPRRTALFLLNNILGGPGMNSLLNEQIREKRGLVYTVESTAFSYSDTGLWSVYFGCDAKDTQRCRKLVTACLDRLCQAPLSDAKLRAAKKQLMGQIRIAGDNLESYALALGKTYARTGKHRDVDLICDRIASVLAQDLLQVAQDIFDPRQLSSLVYL